MQDTVTLDQTMLQPLGTMPGNISTVMGFDWGSKRIGVATGNCVTFSSRPLQILSNINKSFVIQTIEQLVQEWRPGLFVVGMPLDLDGKQMPACLPARKFGKRLFGYFGIYTSFVWEAYSSIDVDIDWKYDAMIANKQTLPSTSKAETWNEEEIDHYAAAKITESWLQQYRDMH